MNKGSFAEVIIIIIISKLVVILNKLVFVNIWMKTENQKISDY